jgi:tRNA-specific 2-thiouridylase
VQLADGEEGVSPGQACVFYAASGGGERLLGGGWIKSAAPPFVANDAMQVQAASLPAEAFLVGSR